MKLREKLAFWMFATSIVSWVITLAITPVGGWCKSNPHSEDYKNAFVIAGLATLFSIANLLYNNYKSKKS